MPRDARTDDALGAVMMEINTLSDTLRTQRLGAEEATALLHAVMAEIDVAIFAFDRNGQLALVNRYGEHLLGRAANQIIGQRSEDLGLEPTRQPDATVLDVEFPGGSGRWEVRRRTFWQGGDPHELLVLSDVSEPLREQERQAWQRLIRVIGHELNNSLAPIKSIAGSLESMLTQEIPPDDWRDDMRHGLAVIGSRTEALARFTTASARLAKLPAPRFRPVALRPLIVRTIALETRLPIVVREGPDITVSADPDQLEQVLINLLQNAADAALETGGQVMVGWTNSRGRVEITIDDEGPGLQNTTNLFVPFFTTKRTGSGIGLLVSRQIAERHGGSLTLENRADKKGARATLKLAV